MKVLKNRNLECFSLQNINCGKENSPMEQTKRLIVFVHGDHVDVDSFEYASAEKVERVIGNALDFEQKSGYEPVCLLSHTQTKKGDRFMFQMTRKNSSN